MSLAPTIQSVVSQYWTMRTRLYAPPSPVGYQLEQASLETIGSTSSSGLYTNDSWEEYADLVLLVRDLSESELVILGAYYCGVVPKVLCDCRKPLPCRNHGEYVAYERTVNGMDIYPLYVEHGTEDGPCLAPLRNGGLCKRKRSTGIARCKKHQHLSSVPATHITHAGEEYRRQSESEGRVVVSGLRAVRPTISQLAETLGVEGWELASFVREAGRKISERLGTLKQVH